MPFSQGPAVFCLVVVCEKTLSHSGTAEGDDPSAAGLFGDPASSTAGMSAAQRHAAPSHPSTDTSSHLALGVPAVGRDAPRAGDRSRSGAHAHRRAERGSHQNSSLVW